MAIKYAVRDLKTLGRAVQLCAQTRTVVQAGGSLGVFAKHLSREFGAVYCFEPSPRIFRKLVSNVEESNVVLVQAALGVDRNFVSTSTTRRRKTNLPPHDGVTHVSGPGVVPTLRVDDLGLRELDLLVLDLEGQELYALMGAAATVERCRPVVMVEVCENCHFEGLVEDDVRTWLRVRGYELMFTEFSDEVWTCRR